MIGLVAYTSALVDIFVEWRSERGKAAGTTERARDKRRGTDARYVVVIFGTFATPARHSSTEHRIKHLILLIFLSATRSFGAWTA